MLATPAQVTVVAMPGTGSDAHFATRAFSAAAARAGMGFRAVEPDPRAVIASCITALDETAITGPVVVAGISLGAAIALEWVSRNAHATVGVIAALPAWTGPDTTSCPAALSASVTAEQLRADGLAAVVERMRASSPEWLAEALTRSWHTQWPDLPQALDEAAAYQWPTLDALAAIEVPVAVIGASDDPVHPVAVAHEWADAMPNGRVTEVTLSEIGCDPSILGERGLAMLAELTQLSAPR
ncbi:alpha/beta fold hydrolase [Nocardia camponoti]|uniref:AB hydrolase-1 domain-containing protein n=1 Tax=Nocardia camponoti TaxID=1616106 RepID=A0A917QB34_9NOCA|nr:alpha/beta hydrolase [Nocardia camponoti]GGK40934.1 hypothetical protein GCM10011591_10720 [Nocardia camponoti]